MPKTLRPNGKKIYTTLFVILAIVTSSCSNKQISKHNGSFSYKPNIEYEKVYSKDEVDEYPSLEKIKKDVIERVKYPGKAIKNGSTGKVVLELIISPKGEPTNVIVTKSVSASLDKAAVRAVSETSFSPGIKDGQPVPVRRKIPVNFKFNQNND